MNNKFNEKHIAALEAWRDKKEFDWTALLRYFCQILLSERFWVEQHLGDTG